MDRSIVAGSLSDIALQGGLRLEQALLHARAVILVDASGSMDIRDVEGDRRRFDVACEQLAKLQGKMPGCLAIIAFSSAAEFVPGGHPSFLGASTNLTDALRLAQTMDSAEMQFIIISDGFPDNERAALATAHTIKGKISAIYVGPEGSPGQGFLRHLAGEHRGELATAAIEKLAATTTRLLEA